METLIDEGYTLHQEKLPDISQKQKRHETNKDLQLGEFTGILLIYVYITYIRVYYLYTCILLIYVYITYIHVYYLYTCILPIYVYITYIRVYYLYTCIYTTCTQPYYEINNRLKTMKLFAHFYICIFIYPVYAYLIIIFVLRFRKFKN